jgi:type VI protein secretion system component VasK
MANLECPLCHSATDKAGKLRYCPRCGWNKKEAAQQLRVSLRLMPVAIVAAVLAVVVFGRSAPKQSAAMYLLIIGIPLVVYLFAYVSVKRAMSKLDSVPDLPARERVAGETASLIAEPSAKDQALLRTSRPREVQMSARGRKSLGIIATLVCVFEAVLIWQLYRMWAMSRSFEGYQRKDWALVGLVILLVLLPLSTWRTMARERELLENGELTMGRVLKRWNTRDGATVFYEFQDANGQTHKHSGMDYSRTLDIGMPLAVFYDRDNPKRQVAACSALHEVVT